MTTFLNFILAALVILGVVLACWNMHETQVVNSLRPQYPAAVNFLNRLQALANDTAAYNAQAKNPDLAKALQSISTHPAAH